jgi:hypothetical protein
LTWKKRLVEILQGEIAEVLGALFN